MDKYIRVQDIYKHIESELEAWGEEYDVRQVLADLEDAELWTDVEQPKKGNWIAQNPLVDTLECSECGYNILGEDFKSNYCPYCGADMRSDNRT